MRLIEQQSNSEATISHAVSSSDVDYNKISVDDITVTVTGKDPAAVLVEANNREISEDKTTATFQTSLATQPTAPVTITPRSSVTGKGTASVVPSPLSRATGKLPRASP